MKNLIKETLFEVASLLQVKILNSDFVERNYRLIKNILKEKIKRRNLLTKIASVIWLFKPVLLALIYNLINVVNDDISRTGLFTLPISDETYKVMGITSRDALSRN